ncbi:MAG: hypothetical protein KDB53_04920, partial [Planctomycetes bacterium]|nr:hypothetical protein [Planctomycetota bacterium]
MTTRALLAAALVLGMAGLADAQRPPSGFTTLDHPATGLRVFYPKTFDPTPTPPTEELIIGNFEREKPYRARKNDRDRRPESFSVFALPPRTTDGGDTGKVDEAPTSYEDIIEKRNAIHEPMAFMKSRFPQWTVDTSNVEVFEKEDARAYPLRLTRLPLSTNVRGYLYVRRLGGWTVGVVGVADEPVFERMARDFRKVADSVHRAEGFGGIKDDFDTEYEGKEDRYHDIPFRIEARKQMIRGW